MKNESHSDYMGIPLEYLLNNGKYLCELYFHCITSSLYCKRMHWQSKVGSSLIFQKDYFYWIPSYMSRYLRRLKEKKGGETSFIYLYLHIMTYRALIINGNLIGTTITCIYLSKLPEFGKIFFSENTVLFYCNSSVRENLIQNNI